MPTFTLKDPTSANPKDMLNYMQELNRYLKYMFSNLDETNVPKLSTSSKNEEIKPEESIKVVENVTLLASKWENGFYIYSSENVKEDSLILITPDKDASASEIEAYLASSLIGVGQAEGTFVLKYYGEQPTIDISITVAYL